MLRCSLRRDLRGRVSLRGSVYPSGEDGGAVRADPVPPVACFAPLAAIPNSYGVDFAQAAPLASRPVATDSGSNDRLPRIAPWNLFDGRDDPSCVLGDSCLWRAGRAHRVLKPDNLRV